MMRDFDAVPAGLLGWSFLGVFFSTPWPRTSEADASAALSGCYIEIVWQLAIASGGEYHTP
jgi:hypothetical protein